VITALTLVGLASGPAFASWMVPPPPYTAKDFSIVKRNGVYHLFYIRNNPNLPFAETQKDLGHATSKDLYFWAHHPPVLPVRPGTFDNSHVWAPSIVERDGVYYMFYTGVRDSFGFNSLDQRTGLATSTDLFTWNRTDLPIFDCGSVPWALCDSAAASPFRDPMVVADSASGGWWMLYTGSRASDPAGMVVGLASSTGDLASWQDQGYLGITDRSVTFSDVAESPHMFEHAGKWYLFFTTNSGQPISFATAPHPLAPTGAWTYRGRLATMLGYSTSGWFASEYFRDGLVEYFLFVNGDRVEVNKLTWTPNDRFMLTQPDLFHVQSLTWMSGSVRVGQEATLYIQSEWWAGREVTLEAFWLDDGGGWHPISNSLLGIPATIPLTSSVHAFQWLARALPDSLGAPESPRIVVRLPDQTATSNLIQVLPQLGGWNPGLDPPTEPAGGSGEGGEPATSEVNPILRTLRASVFGSLPAVVVDLPEAGGSRLDVFDLQGRRVRTLADRVLPAGASVIGWDGKDESGVRLGRGIYFARLTTAGRVHTSRLLLR